MATVFAQSSTVYGFNSVLGSSSTISGGQVAVILTLNAPGNTLSISSQTGPGNVNLSGNQVAIVFQQVSFNPNDL